jgi:Protein of unknown function (DUF2568)
VRVAREAMHVGRRLTTVGLCPRRVQRPGSRPSRRIDGDASPRGGGCANRRLGHPHGESTPAKIVLAIGAPLAGFAVLGAVDFRHVRFGELVRLVEELVICAVAAAASYPTGARLFGIGLAALSIGYHAFVYASGGRLVESQRAVAAGRRALSSAPGVPGPAV